MGLIDRLFRKRNREPEQSPTAIGMKTFTFELKGAPFEIVLNSAFEDVRPVTGFDWYFMMQLIAPGPDVQSPEEHDKLVLMTERVVLHLSQYAKVCFVGTTTYNGCHEIMFYANREKRADILGNLMEMPMIFQEDEELIARMGHQPRFRAKEDKNWDQVADYYRDLKNLQERHA